MPFVWIGRLLILSSFCFFSPILNGHPPPAKMMDGKNRPIASTTPELPQCTDNFVLSSEVQMERALGGQSASGEEEVKRLNITAHLQLATIALGETFCMLITANKTAPEDGEEDGTRNSAELLSEFGLQQEATANRLSMLHTIEYVRLELHHSITGAYKFAIPAITPRCKCDCAGGETICSIEKYQYRNCSGDGALCYRTHRSGQANTGCLTSAKAEICCQVEINPYRDWSFQAIRLNQPSTVLVLRYRIFERAQSSQWANSVDETVAIPLNKGITKFELNAGTEGREEEESRHKVEISAAGGRPHRQMEPGMYFYQIFGEQRNSAPNFAELRNGVPLNGLGESSLEKLGWMRWERGTGWTVRKGLEKITQAQHVSVEDCKAQRYRATFNAEQFVLRTNGVDKGGKGGNGQEEEAAANFDLGTLVKEEPWVGAVRVGEREVVVEHAEGVSLVLTIRTESRPRIVHHSSQFGNFSGTIVLDKQSNRYLNLTFHNARGTLIGQIFSSSDSLSVMESIFSIDIGKFTMEKFQRIVATSVQSPKLVCFYPIGDIEGRICQRLDFVGEPLQEKHHFADQWQQGQTECHGCNERGVDSFLASLDPRQWLDGLNTPAEFFTCILELVLCLALLLLSVLLLTKCVIPLCRCVCFVAKPAKKN